MKSRPIIFRGDMVRAILAGTKTQTRRVVKPTAKGCTVGVYSDSARGPYECVNVGDDGDPIDSEPIRCPYGVPGDELFVREAFASFDNVGRPIKPSDATYVVLRDGTQVYRDGVIVPRLAEYALGAGDHIKWRPSIHMPRWASRLTLVVRSVRVERLSAITDEDAIAEGTTFDDFRWILGVGRASHARLAYVSGFRQMHKLPADADPWLWVVTFGVKPCVRSEAVTLPDPEQFVRDSLFAAGVERAKRLVEQFPPPSRADDFRDLVRRMREAQRDYFRGRDRFVLAEAQRLEREVDAALDATERTGDLFQ